MANNISNYYKRVISLVLDVNFQELSGCKPGHCMKITGFGLSEFDYMWDLISVKFTNLDVFIISENQNTEKFITATKLIEFRNKQEKPLLVLIPSNIRTAAEDSYGNATFKEISLDGIDKKLLDQLFSELPLEFQKYINVIFDYLKVENLDKSGKINYLLALIEIGINPDNCGKMLYYLNLIPDSILLNNSDQVCSRLNFNIASTKILSSFNKSIYDRISELPLEPNTIQKNLVEFVKCNPRAKTKEQITLCIYEKYPNLYFENWSIPDLDFDNIKLFVDNIKSNDFKEENGKKFLFIHDNKSSKIKLRITTLPTPNEINKLKYFKIYLMSVDGGAGTELLLLRKLKRSISPQTYRDITVEINPNIIEEGSYFLKVLAEDEHGNILNSNDDFKDHKVQKAWEELQENSNVSDESSFLYKRTCDSDDFHVVIDDNEEIEEIPRKDNLQNILQAYFKFRIDLFKNHEESSVPVPSSDSNLWLNDDKLKHLSVFYINYSSKHNYQVQISSKLRKIENAFLLNGGELGHLQVLINNNSTSYDLDSVSFIRSELSSIASYNLLNKRKEIFNKILNSNIQKNGIFETADIFTFHLAIKEYLFYYNDWTSNLRKQIESKELNNDERNKLQQLILEIQLLDIAKIRTNLPDGTKIDALLLSPLHPLRLTWFMQLFDVFSNWEEKTKEFDDHLNNWKNNLEEYFDGLFYPQNNLIVLVEPNSLKSYFYSGELAFGWGLYLTSVERHQDNRTLTSNNRLLKHYLRLLLNVSKENYVDTDISQKLIIRHIKNYLIQHPYVDKMIINLINAGDAGIFADALVELEKDPLMKSINYEICLFKGIDHIIEHGEGFRNLLNPEFNISEEAESFSQPSKNRLFPKLRFSINRIDDYLKTPSKYIANLSFLISPFPVDIELVKSNLNKNCFYLNGLITDSILSIEKSANEVKWLRHINCNGLVKKYSDIGEIGISIYSNLQLFISVGLASKFTESLPAARLKLNDQDQVLLSHLHEYSDWVITFDKNLGPQIYDQPSQNGRIPFLLDYIPGEEKSGISSYLTTRPTSEIFALLGPHFQEFDLDVTNFDDKEKIMSLLEDLRAVSSSLVLQLNSSKNKAFEVIGTAFTKRVLEKKGILNNSFLIPIDLHQNLFENLPIDNKSRADNLLVTINTEKREISFTVIEIKCRKSIGDVEADDLKLKMKDQIENTIKALRIHFDPEFNSSYDRLDREIKNIELKSLISFYIGRANRYTYLTDQSYNDYDAFIQTLDLGFSIQFKQLGLIYNLSAPRRHLKEIINQDLTIFTFGRNLIEDIIDPNSDLNTKRLEEHEFDAELIKALQINTNKDSGTLIIPVEKTNIPTIQLESIQIIDNETIYKKSEITQDNELNFTKVESIDFVDSSNFIKPEYDILIGKTSESDQYGLIGKTIHGKKVALDLSETNTISLFGIQGGGKSYSIGTVTEMVLQEFDSVNKLQAPLAGVIFHYSESMDYEPEFTSMITKNDNLKEIEKLKLEYGAEPHDISDVIILTPKDKIEERQLRYPSIEVFPIAFNSKELKVQDWMFLLGAIGNDSTYIKQLKTIMKENRRDISLSGLSDSVESSVLLSNSQKVLARQKLSFAREYIDDTFFLKDKLRPGRLIIVDLRDEFIVKDEALGLFVIMLNIFSDVNKVDGKHFNKFIVFDEAHKYMDNKDITNNIVSTIREMRHKGVSIMIASQDPPSLPNEIIELSSIILLHKFNSPQWLKHVQKSITQLSTLTPTDLSALNPGEGFIWSSKATEKSITTKPVKIITRPRVSKHGGGTIKAI